MSHKDEGLKTRHRQYWKKIEADSVVLDPGIIAISWEDSTIRLHDGYTIGGRIFSMLPAPSLTVHVLTPLSGNGSVSAPIALNIAALANQVPVLANAPITGTGIIGNPLDIDEAALALALTNQVGVAHDASLVGTGATGAPLSVNWGLAPAQPVAHNATLSGNGTAGSPLSVVPAALASQIPVSAITPITGNGTLASPLAIDTPALIPALNNKVTVVTDGVTITGAGIVGNPLVAIPAPATVIAASPLTGNGSAATPLDVNIASLIAEISAAGGVPVTHDGSMLGMGTTLSPLSVNWANMPALSVQHDTSMTGQGTAGNPLSVNWSQAPAINVNHDGTMTGSGTLASPLSVNAIALANLVPVTVGAGLTGNGTIASPIAPNPVVLGPALSGLVPVAVSAPITGTGTSASPLGITNASGALRGVVQLATAAEGLQPANDVDATTPAYVAAAIAALPGEKYLQGLQSYDAATNIMTLLMNDGSTVAVNLTAIVNDAVASVPNKHVPAVITSPDGSVTVTTGGTDNQTFTVETTAGAIPIVDVGNLYTSVTVENALQEVAGAIFPRWSFADLQTEINQSRLVDGALLSTIMHHDAANNHGFGALAFRNLPGGNTTSVAFGYLAGADLSAVSNGSVHLGYGAGYQGSGLGAVNIGLYAGQAVSGASNIFIGHQNGRNAIATNTTSIGGLAGYASNGTYNQFYGYIAGNAFTGSFSTGIGYQALSDTNVGVNGRITAVGVGSALACNNVYQTDLFGHNAGRGMSNIADSVGAGAFSLSYSSSIARVASFGYSAGEASNGDDNVFIGYRSGNGWFGSKATLVGNEIFGAIGGAVGVTITVPNIINYAAHGIPIGDTRVFQLTATTYPAGGPAAPHNVTVIADTANTLTIVNSITYSSPGVGVQVALYQGSFTNCGGFGYQAVPTADNQIRLGNALMTEVRTAAQHYAAAYNVVSDKRLKTDFEAIPDDIAIELSRIVPFTTFMRIRDGEKIKHEFETRLSQLRSELLYSNAHTEASDSDSDSDSDVDNLVARPVRTVAEIKKELASLEAECAIACDPVNLAFGHRQAGVIAQEIMEITKKLGWGDFLVHEADNRYTVDFNSLLAIMIRGFQLRLEKAGI